MSHITEQFAEDWYKQEVDPSSKDRDPMLAKINRKQIPKIGKGYDRNKRTVYRVNFMPMVASNHEKKSTQFIKKNGKE